MGDHMKPHGTQHYRPSTQSGLPYSNDHQFYGQNPSAMHQPQHQSYPNQLGSKPANNHHKPQNSHLQPHMQHQHLVNNIPNFQQALHNQIPSSHYPPVARPDVNQTCNISQGQTVRPSVQQQFIGSRPQTPNFNLSLPSNQHIRGPAMPTNQPSAAPFRHPDGSSLDHKAEQVSHFANQGQPPMKNYQPNLQTTSNNVGHQNFNDINVLQKSPMKSVQNTTPLPAPASQSVRSNPPVIEKEKFVQKPLPTSNNYVAPPSRHDSSKPSNEQRLPSSHPKHEGESNCPMLLNPLLKNVQETDRSKVVSSQSLPQLIPPSKQNVSSSTGNHAKRETAYDDDEDEDDDEDDERSDSYSSGSTTSSSNGDENSDTRKDRATNAQYQRSQKQVGAKVANHQSKHVPPVGVTQGARQAPQLDGNKSYNYEAGFQNMHVENHRRCVDLFREQNITAELEYDESSPPLHKDMKQYNCPPDIMNSTLNMVPGSSDLLTKARLPFGILFHPLKDIQDFPETRYLCRCRMCRAYMNPFVTLVDSQRWRCNICSRYNQLPEDYLLDRETGKYTDGRHRPEMSFSCYELICEAESANKNRPVPTYAFLLDVSFNAIETGYLSIVCEQLLENLSSLSRDPKARICFMTFNSHIQLYNLDHTMPRLYHLPDLEDIELPSPKGLLVNVNQSKEVIKSLLKLLPSMHKDSNDTGNCLGTALKTAYMILENTGGRVTVFQTKIPDIGEGSLKVREDPNKRASEDVQHLSPATDFYKNIAVNCSTNQIGFDLFFLNSQYVDIASISPVAKYTGGSVDYFPNFSTTSNPVETERFRMSLGRYFTREVAFAAVFKIRCTRGLSFKMFHGNGFVRQIDLLTLPICNSDAGFGVQVAIDEVLEGSHVCFQAVLLYTNSRGQRRLRIENLCLKVSHNVTDIFYHANQQAIVAFVAKMAANRALASSVLESREALTHVPFDLLEAFSKNLNSSFKSRQLPCPYLLRALPMFIFALMKYPAFRLGISTKLDDRVFALEQMKTLPWPDLLQLVYPHFYALHNLDDKNAVEIEDKIICQTNMLPLTAGSLERQGIHLLDTGSYMYLWLTSSIDRRLLRDVFGTSQFGNIKEGLIELPILDNQVSDNIRNFIEYLNMLRQIPSPLILIRDDSRDKVLFYEKLVEDRTNDLSNMSYIEFLRSLYNKLSTE